MKPRLAADLANFVAWGSRFFNGLSNHPAFQQSDLDVVDWVALSLLSETESLSVPRLAQSMGIGRARMQAVANGLRKAGYVVLAPAPNGKMANLRLSALGLERLESVNDLLEPHLLAVVGTREKIISNVSQRFRWLTLKLVHGRS